MSYWQRVGGAEELPLAYIETLGDDVDDVDVLVVGAGVCGLSHALRSAQQGQRVVVAERTAAVGQGASGTNGGHLWPAAQSAFERHCCHELRLLTTALRNNDHAHSLLLLQRDEKTSKDNKDDNNDNNNDNDNDNNNNLLSVQQLQLREPLLRASAFAGAYSFEATSVNAHLLCRELASLAAATRRVQFAFRCTVVALSHDAQHRPLVHVQGRARPIRCGRVFVACNAWTSQLLPELSITPVRGQVIHVKFLRPHLKLNHGLSWDDDYQYAAPVDDGMVFGGARWAADGMEVGVSDDSTTNPQVSAALRKELLSKFRLEEGDYVIDHEWTGIMGFTPDRKPYVGRVRPNIDVAAGFNGHGMPVAFLAAKVVAEMALGLPVTCPLPEEWDVKRVLLQQQQPSQQHLQFLVRRNDGSVATVDSDGEVAPLLLLHEPHYEASLQRLIRPLLEKILSYLHVDDIACVAFTCRRLWRIASVSKHFAAQAEMPFGPWCSWRQALHEAHAIFGTPITPNAYRSVLLAERLLDRRLPDSYRACMMTRNGKYKLFMGMMKILPTNKAVVLVESAGARYFPIAVTKPGKQIALYLDLTTGQVTGPDHVVVAETFAQILRKE